LFSAYLIDLLVSTVESPVSSSSSSESAKWYFGVGFNFAFSLSSVGSGNLPPVDASAYSIDFKVSFTSYESSNFTGLAFL